MVKRIIIIATIIILFANLSFAITAEEIFAKMKETQAGINTAKCKVETTSYIIDISDKHFSSAEKSQIKLPLITTSTSIFYLKKPYNYRVEELRKNEISFITIYNGIEMLEYSKYKNTLNRNKTESGKYFQFLVYFTSISDTLRDDGAQFIGEENIDGEDCYIIKEGENEKLWINKNNYLIKQVEVLDNKKNKYTTKFKEIEINILLQDKLFDMNDIQK